MTYEQKKELLRQRMAGYAEQDTAVAFSGGVDSSLLLYLAAREAAPRGTKVYALTADTVLHPAADLEIARKVAREAGALHRVIRVDENSNPAIRNNPADRCYHCKKQLFLEFQKVCRELDIPCLLEGSNADDLKVYRPGIRAVRELGVDSPLAEAGVTKEEVRRMASELGISTASRPSTPCMATRLPYGTFLDPALLARIVRGEAYLQERGFAGVRLRVHGDITRLEIPPEQFAELLAERREITETLQGMGFRYITLDLEGLRSGSMDEYLTKEERGEN